MKLSRRVLGLGVLLLALLALALPAPKATAASGGNNNFSIQSFDADYYLSRTDSNRSEMNVVEKITVRFLPIGDNHGIERSIPNSYNGHTVHFAVVSVKDDTQHNLEYTTYGSNGNTVIRIGDPNKLVGGIQTYVIDYQLQDVTQQFKDHDEIYWDTNGTDWGETFESLTARLHLDADLAKTFNGNYTCYEGVQSATSHCISSVVKKDNETVLTFQSSRFLYAGENVTFVAGFKPHTFAAYQPTKWERVFPWLLGGWFALGGLVLLYTLAVMVRAWQRYGRSPAGKGTIVPEYIPPKDISVLVSSTILKHKGSDVTAQIIDLAVRHYLKIYETKTKGTWFLNKHSYELELTHKLTGLRSEEKRLLEIIFGEKPNLGQRVTLEGLKSNLYKDTTQLEKEVETDARVSGYVADRDAERKRYYTIGGLVLLAGILILNPGVVLAGVAVLCFAANFHPLTEKGVDRRDYLRGLEMYMQLAEAERIRYLQSPQGAVKTKVDASNTKRLVLVYERLLPYAIVFGIEHEWAKEFAPLYQQPPDWYVGNWSAFNTGVFVASLSNFSVASNLTFAPPSSSSASGFSTGGGFSGGGGGGGGGGGW
jgi:Predicted membrane protein (DUF2207) C-terminal domain/Predicted membrane protein (DUF2207) N-terminal domain